MAASAFAVESANVVGFDTKTGVQQFNWIAPEFSDVGLTTIDIQNITLSGNAVDPNGGDSLQILDADGVTQYSFSWSDPDDTGTVSWFDEDAWAPAEYSIGNSDSVLIYCVNAGVQIKMAGEVGRGTLVKTGVQQFNWVGNVSPVAIDVQDITLSGNAVDPNGGDSLQILDADGVTQYSFSWSDPDDTGTVSWFDEDAWAPAEQSIPAGSGVLIYAVNANVTITLPQALAAN